MSEPKRISPLLDQYAMGEPVSDHHGVRCCPAMDEETNEKYIVKVISVPASQVQLDALLLTGACKTNEEALSYFQELADGVMQEAETLKKLAALEGFISYQDWQCVPMEEGTGFDIYLLGTYKKTLARFLQKNTMTQLSALNLGLDLCAALAVCRRAGFLYADLKPENIFMNDEKEFRIGDLGFIRLSSLPYASLPDKYRSVYTAPEISDAYSALNDTIDVYAAGLILYQVFNGGTLPFTSQSRPEEALPVPLYADYEMAEIILKACDPDPANRWQDPIQMGQAIISYMQRNGANDVPIVPAPIEDTAEEVDENISDSDATLEEAATAEAEEIIPAESDEADTADTNEEDSENISFLDDESDETTLEYQDEEIEYDEVSEEVSDILTQVDELVAHPTPDPVIPPEKIDVPMPEPIVIQSEEAEEPSDDEEEPTVGEEQPEEEQSQDETEETIDEKPKKHWLRNSLILVLLLGLIAAGTYLFQHFYMQGIESIQLEGNNTALTVYVAANEGVDTNKLAVVCYDASGIKYQTPVTDGKAVFNSLMPGRNYQVEVIPLGFHKLYGNTTGTYSTPEQTNVIQFGAVTGSGSGTAIVSFAIDGPDSNSWQLRIFTPGEEDRYEDFSGHMLNITGLTVGKEYTFTLVASEALHITGQKEIKHTASDLILPQNLAITGCIDGVLSAAWSAPAGVQVDSWTVHCYNEAGFEATVVTEDTSVQIEGVDPTQGYIVDVTAAGMSVSERAATAGNAITASNAQITQVLVNEKFRSLLVSWESPSGIPQGGWILKYTVDNYTAHQIETQENSVQLETAIPGSTYRFTLEAADGTEVLTAPLEITTPVADAFSGYSVDASELNFSMCRYPGWQYWDRYDLDESDYTNEFVVEQAASFLVRAQGGYDDSWDDITTLYVVRDAEGNIVTFSYRTRQWSDMWYAGYCELDIPDLPKVPGEYTISVFFNGQFTHEQSFQIHPNASA